MMIYMEQLKPIGNQFRIEKKEKKMEANVCKHEKKKLGVALHWS